MKILSKKTSFYFICLFNLSASIAEPYAPHVEHDYPMTAYWGDTHLHTNLSTDAYIFGNTNLTADEAYRFARGEAVTADGETKARLTHPLDFLVIADHSEGLGSMAQINAQDPLLLGTASGKLLYETYRQFDSPEDAEKERYALYKLVGKVRQELAPESRDAFSKKMWSTVTAKADQYNDPGKFTTFIGYEWSSWGSGSENLHRVVIFKDGADKANQILPFSSTDSSRPEDLWRFFADYSDETGGDILAIPHNSNLSAGHMFLPKDSDGRALNRQYAETRSRWEPLVEATQIKGDSETHPLLSPTDEFADFETWESLKPGTDGKQWKHYEYVRSALKLGLAQQEKLGINPFKFGLVGSTDSHTSLATAEENNFWGKHAGSRPEAGRMTKPMLSGETTPYGRPFPLNWKTSAAGYAAVWATENTREALFAAMKRRETYATTGPRINVRFFGGWDYDKNDAFRPDLAAIGYRKGVPMGGDLTGAAKGKAPRFLIRAVKDPNGANLDRAQVIKGWRSEDGELHEQVYNVVLSDGRKDKSQNTPSVGNTVNVSEASYTNTIGAPELATVWTDPDFDADELAFYYLRVIEIPTPRWTAYDANRFGIRDIPEDIPMITQERAYTSPIWYTPE